MLLLATQAQPQMRAHRHPNLGRLVQPRHYGVARSYVRKSRGRGLLVRLERRPGWSVLLPAPLHDRSAYRALNTRRDAAAA
jgi:hypothetical protein